jgi:hypothetical protein
MTIDIPKEAHQPRPHVRFIELSNAKEWFCPDCNAHGNGIGDFINHSQNRNEHREPEEYDEITLSCEECCNQNIYITTFNIS